MTKSISDVSLEEYTALRTLVLRIEDELQECRRLLNQQAAQIERLQQVTLTPNPCA